MTTTKQTDDKTFNYPYIQRSDIIIEAPKTHMITYNDNNGNQVQRKAYKLKLYKNDGKKGNIEFDMPPTVHSTGLREHPAINGQYSKYDLLAVYNIKDENFASFNKNVYEPILGYIKDFIVDYFETMGLHGGKKADKSFYRAMVERWFRAPVFIPTPKDDNTETQDPDTRLAIFPITTPYLAKKIKGTLFTDADRKPLNVDGVELTFQQIKRSLTGTTFGSIALVKYSEIVVDPMLDRIKLVTYTQSLIVKDIKKRENVSRQIAAGNYVKSQPDYNADAFNKALKEAVGEVLEDNDTEQPQPKPSSSGSIKPPARMPAGVNRLDSGEDNSALGETVEETDTGFNLLAKPASPKIQPIDNPPPSFLPPARKNVTKKK